MVVGPSRRHDNVCVGPNTQATPEGGGLGTNEGGGLRGHREIGMVVGGGGGGPGVNPVQ